MSRLLLNENPLVLLPSLVRAFGFAEAAFLQQLHYFSEMNRVGDRNQKYGKTWVYNTAQEWVSCLYDLFSEKTIRRAIKNLEDNGVVFSTSEFNKAKFDRTKWYAINYEKLDEVGAEIEAQKQAQMLCQNDQMEADNLTTTSGQFDQMEADNLTVLDMDKMTSSNTKDNQREPKRTVKEFSAQARDHAQDVREEEKSKRAEKSEQRFDALAALLGLGVDAQVAADWLEVRKGKRAKLTQTAIDALCREAKKAGISVAEAVRICAERGWQGFNASWNWRDAHENSKPKSRHDLPDSYSGGTTDEQLMREEWFAMGEAQ